jgi:general secretion pathway protein J
MIARPTPASAEAGFTLVELLIAMTLLGFLTMLLFGSLRFGVRAWDRSTEHTTGSDEIRLVQAFVRTRIERAYPHVIASERAAPHVDFSGTAHSLEFLTVAPASLGVPGRARVQIAKVARGDGFDLALTVWPELATASNGATERMLSGLASADLAYFGNLSGQDAAWHDQWNDSMELPKLVRIRAAFPAGDARVWPELIVAPAISADVACMIDAFTHACRGRR